MIHNYLPVVNTPFLLMLLKSVDHLNAQKSEVYRAMTPFHQNIMNHQDPLDFNISLVDLPHCKSKAVTECYE
jgi:hypothetical protein